MTFDLTIRGAGIFGLSIAWEATCRGASVQIIDPHGVGTGASGGVLGALQPHTPDHWNAKKQFQFESLMLAESFWTSVDALSGMSSDYGRVGRLQPVMNERGLGLARDRCADAELRWGDKAQWEVIRTEASWAPTSGTGWYVHDTFSAIVNPKNAIESLTKALADCGVNIVSNGDDHGATVWATGWQGLRALSDHFGQDIGRGEKGQAALLAYEAAGQPQIFADGLHIIPHLNGTVGVGSTSERAFEHPTRTDTKLDDVIARAQETLPILKGARVLNRWAGVRPRGVTRAPILGSWPGRARHFVANGGFKIGFGMAPKIAQIMCNLILDKKDEIPEDFRFLPPPAKPDFTPADC